MPTTLLRQWDRCYLWCSCIWSAWSVMRDASSMRRDEAAEGFDTLSSVIGSSSCAYWGHIWKLHRLYQSFRWK